jgi:hypothetical protein
MKNVLFSLVFMLIGSLAFAHTNNTEIIAIGEVSRGGGAADDATAAADDFVGVTEDAMALTDDDVTSPDATVAAPASCWIVKIKVSCGGTYNTQYCNEGLHGTLNEWVMQVDNWACN